MIQGSNMSRSHKGMRKGISLVEMLIAIVLFGVLSVVSFKYSKNFINTDLAAKQARVSALIDQATQLSTAYDVYSAKFGTAPILITDLNASNAKVLTDIPVAITEIGAAWSLEVGTDYTGSGTNDIAFSFPVTNVTPSTSNEEYCAVFNNSIDSSLSLDVTDGQDFGFSTVQYPLLGNAFCFGTGLTVEIVFIKEAN